MWIPKRFRLSSLSPRFSLAFFRWRSTSTSAFLSPLSNLLSFLSSFSNRKNSCDTTVHGANEATAKHLRLPLPQFSLGFKSLSAGGDRESKGKETATGAATGAATAATTAAAATAEAKGKGRASSPEQQAKAAAAAAQAQMLQQRAQSANHQQQQQQQQQAAQQQQQQNLYGDLWAPSAPGMTLAAELLGLPPDAVGDFSVKDVDAAYMLAEEADFDADLSAILEVPDIDFLPPANGGGGGASGSGAAMPPPPQAALYSNDNGAGPSNAPQQASGGGRGGGSRRGGAANNNNNGGGGEIDGVVPELQQPKRARR